MNASDQNPTYNPHLEIGLMGNKSLWNFIGAQSQVPLPYGVDNANYNKVRDEIFNS